MSLEDEKNVAENKNNKTKEIMERLEKGIMETMNSERYRAFLKLQSHFHSYSYNNTLLIFLQRPDASMVAGFSTWKKLGRFVKKGETGITILAPDPYKYYKLVDKLDPQTKEPIRDPNSVEIIKEKVECTGLSFKAVHVFDLKQTDGKELPSICNELQGNSINAESIIRAIKNISQVPIIEKDIPNGAKGYYSRSEGIIAIQQGMSFDQTAKTLIHEYAHSLLHSSEEGANLNRETKEVQAESVAFIVSEKFGVDTSQYTFDYLASWSSGKELAELKKSFNTIQKCANGIIENMEEFFKKEIELQKSSQLESASKEVPLYKMFYSGEQDKDAISFQKETGYKRIWIPESQGANGDMWAVYKDIDALPKWAQKFAGDMEKSGQNVTVDGLNIKDKIIAEYSADFPAIKFISGSTANYIDNINKDRESNITIKEIKSRHKEIGKQLEGSSDKSATEKFNALNNVVDDIKQAQLKAKKVQAQERAEIKHLNQDMDMVR